MAKTNLYKDPDQTIHIAVTLNRRMSGETERGRMERVKGKTHTLHGGKDPAWFDRINRCIEDALKKLQD